MSAMDSNEQRAAAIHDRRSWGGLRERRRRIFVPETVIEACPLAVFELMSTWIVVRCEFRYASCDFDYTAVSPLFEPCEPNVYAPEFMVRCTYSEPGKPSGVELVPWPDTQSV